MNSKTRLPSEPRKKAGKSALPGASFLRAELHRFQDLGLGRSLRKVVWQWNGSIDKEAEVVGDVVFVYVRDREAAVQALRHEVLHFEIASCQQPFVELINRILAGINQQAYRLTEALTEKLSNLIADEEKPSLGLMTSRRS